MPPCSPSAPDRLSASPSAQRAAELLLETGAAVPEQTLLVLNEGLHLGSGAEAQRRAAALARALADARGRGAPTRRSRVTCKSAAAKPRTSRTACARERASSPRR